MDYGSVRNFDPPLEEDVVMAEETVLNSPRAVDSAMDEDDWSLEYDLDDQREQEALKDPANQIEEEGESELDNFTNSSESESEEDLDGEEDELARMDDVESEYQASEGSQDGVLVIDDDDVERSSPGSSGTNHDQPPLGDE